MLYNQRGKEKGNSLIHLLQLLFIIFLLLSCEVESRLRDGSDNNIDNPTPDGDSMIKTPSDIVDIDPKQPIPKCTDLLPADTYPMPRCVSNIITNYRLDQFDIQKAMGYRSKRQTSHLTTFFAQFVSFDIIGSKSQTQPSLKLYIPSDDETYNTYNSVTALPVQLSNSKALPFNRSDFLPTSTQKPKRTGYNDVTPFLDLSAIYGITAEDEKNLREGNRGKLKISGNAYDPYPFKDQTTGNYVTGPVGKRAINIFTMAIQTIWLREHNRLCDYFHEKNGDTWNDTQYYEEAMKWNIAFYQKVVIEEYLGVVTGKPLPPYQKYNPHLTPGIDVFFSTITFRYGHSELSDFYQIHDDYDGTIVELSLQNTMKMGLLEKFGAARLLRSMSMQRQEDVDIYYSDASRNVKSPDPNTYDLPAFDVLRARDRGISLYNNVRQAYGLKKKDSWADITSVKEIQDNLQQLYPNGVDQLEALVGAMAEDHLNGSNFGELMNISMITQFMNIRDSDRFWWENKDNGLFTDEDRAIIRNTTFRDIIMRNLAAIFQPAIPQSIWSVQPPQKLADTQLKYLNRIALWPTAYIVGYEIVGNDINFQVQILTTGGNAWFGMGFDPDDDGMSNAEFIVGIISNGNISSLSNYDSTGYNPPMYVGDDSDLQIIKFTPPANDNFAIIEFSRPLEPSGRKPIRNGLMKYVLAYNPTSSVFSYHQNNRQIMQINFYNYILLSPSNGLRYVKLAHGLGMFLSWCVLFPASIYIVRYYKHTNNYIKIHRFVQLLGSICIVGFGAAAMATLSIKTNHSLLGLSIYILLFIELGLGLISIWGQEAIVSVNQGYPRFVKRIHRFFGISLILSAWVNVYLGIETYSLSYGVESLYYRIAYLAWIGVVIVTFMFGEYWWNWRGTWKWKYIQLNFEKEKKSILSLHITKDLDKLPEFTWREVNERVQRGAYLVVCDGFIVNMRKWIRVHPGGAKILESVIGTDITNDFFGYKGKEIIEHIDLPEIKSTGNSTANESVLGQYTNILHERTKKYTTQKNSVAQVVDDMNIKYFLKAPLAIHPHSLFAIKKIATMVVAKLKNSSDVELSSAPIFEPTDVADGGLSDEEIAKQDTAFRIMFRRYKLTSKVPVNANKEFPVMKFTFTIVHQNIDGYKSRHHKLKFLPGHYIEVQSRIKGQVVIRSYTPIEGNIVQSFSIFVKVYPDGLMSRHLNEQLKGYEIQVRGPFDVGDREVLETSSISQAADITSLYRKSSLYTKKYIPFISSSTSSLLNPNTHDGHWKELYMICGGTGIAPMLQLITYHLELSMRRSHASTMRNKEVTMHLLYGNKKIEDIINGIELEEYEMSSRGMLTITYALDEQIQDWKGESGEIDQEMILDWLNSKASNLIVNNNNSSNDYEIINDNNNITVPSSSTSPNSSTNPTSLLPYKKHPSYVASSTDKNKKPNSVQFIDDNNTTNTANSPIASRSPSRTNTPLSYVASLTDKNKKPNSIQFIDDNNTMNTTNSPIVSRSSSRLDTPLSYVSSLTNKNKRPNIMQFNDSNNTTNTTNLPTVSNPNDSNTNTDTVYLPVTNNVYRTSINPESALSHNYIDSSQSPSPVDINGDSEIDSQFSETYSSTADDNKKPKLDPNSKIIVCGQPGMINVVEKSLKNLGFTEDDFILIT
ncbi:7546_t:CDS:10 [Entrophospora sp. SA101]|nr:7546_t:CDS:10 [Entrophospora sp. SA101]